MTLAFKVMETKYNLIKTRNGWLLQPDYPVIKPETCHTFESTASLAKHLPTIIDPEAAKAIIASLPPRENGKFDMEDDELKFTCQFCGKEFDPDPDTIVETGFSSDYIAADLSTEQLEEMVASGEAFTAERLEAMSEYELSEHGLSLKDRENLLAGNTVDTGGMCVCRECQDEMEVGQ